MTTRFIIVNDGTIRESRAYEDSRLRKRQRLEQDDSDEDIEINYPVPALLVHDAQYYIDDPEASCYVRVEDVLFKVHQHVLESSETVEWMLSHHLEERSTSIERPFVGMYGASVEEFRALLWRQYTSSDKLHHQPNDQADLDRLLSLAKITYKFHYKTLHLWTIAVINCTFAANAVFADTCSSATFTRAVDVAASCEASELLHLIEARWGARIRHRDIPAVPAILSADRYNLRVLRRIAYYVHIQETMELRATITESGTTQFQVDPKLSNVQAIRLFSGHLSLLRFWERLHRKAPKLRCVQGCDAGKHSDVCSAVWEDRWRAAANSERVLAHDTADIFAILSAMHEELSVDPELKRRVLPGCRLAGLDGLHRASSDLSDTLPDHFFGCI